MDGLTMTQFKTTFPGEYKARQENKLTYRYPGGESYRDVIQRLEPVIFELERATHNVCVVGHRAVLRCLYAYFVDCPEEDIPWLPIKLHEVNSYSLEFCMMPIKTTLCAWMLLFSTKKCEKMTRLINNG